MRQRVKKKKKKNRKRSDYVLKDSYNSKNLQGFCTHAVITPLML